MVSPGLEAILVHYFRKWVFGAHFGAHFGAENKGFGVTTEANVANDKFNLQ